MGAKVARVNGGDDSSVDPDPHAAEPDVVEDEVADPEEQHQMLVTWLTARRVRRLEFLRWLYEQPERGGL